LFACTVVVREAFMRETSVLPCGFGFRAPIFAMRAKLFRFNAFTQRALFGAFSFTFVNER
jgi:hypothetical protein